MFERYTEKARRTIFFARYEASQFGSPAIETEHLLLGLMRENRDLAQRYLGEPFLEDTRAPSPEIAEADRRIKWVVEQMEQALSKKDFEQARFYSDEERNEREKKRRLVAAEPAPGSDGYAHYIRRQIEERTGLRPKVSTSKDLPLSQESKHVLAYAGEEAERLKHRHIDAQHMLLGLLRVEKSFAAEIMRERGLRLEKLREDIAGNGPEEIEVRTVLGTPRRREDFERGFGGGMGSGAWEILLKDAGRTVVLARQAAATRNASCIETMDLLTAVSMEKEFRDRFPQTAATLEARPQPAADTRRESVSSAELVFTEDCKQVFVLAAQEAAQAGQRTGLLHLILGILGVESCAAAEVLRECGLTVDGVRAQLAPPPSDPQEGRSYV